MAACHSRCQVVSLDCSQSLTGRKQHPILSGWREQHGLGSIWILDEDIQFSHTRFYCSTKKNLSTMAEQCKKIFIVYASFHMMYMCWQLGHPFTDCKFYVYFQRIFLQRVLQCVFSVSSLWFCNIGFSVCDIMRLMTLSHTSEASLTKIQQRNVHSIFVSFLPFKRHSNQH